MAIAEGAAVGPTVTSPDMSVLRPSAEGSSLLQDPWDWTVDQVVFALTDQGSVLLKENSTLSLPDANQFANALYENDVTGLALLTEVHTASLREDLNIKSMGHRATINHLIRQLQDMSAKYQEQLLKNRRASSVGMNTGMGNPFFGRSQSFEGAAMPNPSAIWSSSLAPSGRLQISSWMDGIRTPVQAQTSILRESATAEAPDLPKPGWHSVSAGACPKETGGSITGNVNGEQLTRESEDFVPSPVIDSVKLAEHHLIEFEDASQPPEQITKRGETTVIDGTGRKRRRLILSPSSDLKQVEIACAKDSVSEEGQSAQDPPRILGHTDESFEESKADVSDPGAVFLDEHGRKRLRPILLTQSTVIAASNSEEDTNARLQFPLNFKASTYMQPAHSGRKTDRKDDQSYLGIMPFTVDSLFYAGIPLESQLDQAGETELYNDSDDFTIVSCPKSGKGRFIYTNTCMKYFFRSQTLKVQSGKCKGTGIIPYPDRLGKKHYPLSMTVFHKSPDGILVVRSNRSKWLKDTSRPSQTCLGDNQVNAFSVADPIFAHDDGEDPEWKSLEKWNHMDADDTVLPIYGESGSEGGYESDTWKEMEQERGDSTGTAQKLASQKLSLREIEDAIALALEQLLAEWQLKRKPKLQQKAWHFWTKSRSEGILMVRKDDLTDEIRMLDNRITTLRTEILGQEWSNSSEVGKQCKILQPTVFDREDRRWKLTTLDLKERPEKLPSIIRISKAKKVPGPEEALDNDELENDESNLVRDSEISDSSDGSLDDFIVQDNDALDGYQPAIEGEEPAVDVEGVTVSELEVKQDTNSAHLKIMDSKPNLTSPGRYATKIKVEVPINTSSKLPVVDLTLDSDSQRSPDTKTKHSFEIKTPPITSDSEDDVFQRSRNKKPKFRKPWLPRSSTIINLESDSSDVSATESPSTQNQFPAFDDVTSIRSMNPSKLVERQDRKRLLIWVIAHAPASRRQAVSTYLTDTSFEMCQSNITDALINMRARLRRMPDMDNVKSDSIMSVASWHVCWTIPVKLDSSGLKTSHINATLSDQDGFEPFYDFLLECLSNCQIALNSEELITPTKKRQKIRREPEDTSSPFRKRKYMVNESQATLDKRQAAQDRMHADEERRCEEQRRQKELRSRIKKMGAHPDGPSELVINPGKLKDQEFINLSRAFGNGAPVKIKEHQKEGMQFLWREITAEHEDLQGCLLAQTMGLGKTMQVIALLVTLAEASKSPNSKISNQVPPALRTSRTLILCPPALLENWWDELLIWAPRPFSDSVGEVRKVSASLKAADRLSEIEAWSTKGGVLLLGYDTFKAMIHNRTSLKTAKTPLTEDEHEKVKEALLQRANLIVADEAHTFKARTSKIHLAVNQFKSRSRIAMTGSPLNNNLEEYFTLIDWIAPNYLGTHTEFKANYEEPIQDGLYQDSTQSQFIRSRTKLKALEMELEPKVNRADISVLRTDLKGKMEFVIRVPLSKVQEDVYRIFVDSMRATLSAAEPRPTSLWSWLGVLQLLCNHPQCFRERILALKAEMKTLEKSNNRSQVRQKGPSTADEVVGGSDEDAILLTERESSFTRAIDKCEEGFLKVTESLDEVSLSYKMLILMKILELTDAAQDKTLVFSHRIATLDYIQKQLERNQKPFVRIDGKLHTQKRQQITKDFNEGNINVCLISTRAGGTGLNLFGANRVVILDEHFNPTWEQQAVGRAYRIGQQKIVYVYRLTTGGTFEKAIQNQALFKEQLADRVVDRKNPCRSALRGVGHYLFPPELVKLETLDQFIGKDPLVLDHLLANAMQ